MVEAGGKTGSVVDMNVRVARMGVWGEGIGVRFEFEVIQPRSQRRDLGHPIYLGD